ncbi:GNAT family N-acetyltransferase [Paenibacillus sp. MBLB4367]|uniref:GNAT family N-acetyltransferase n=1 Tax=Paenibacillus sp. MBLB4367 TaxID=3384767 RepID=UPI0039083008
MTDIRQLHADEMSDAVRLADFVFRDQEHISMGEAFPLVFSPSLGQSFGAFEDGKLVAFVGIVPWTIHAGPAQLNIYSLGAVCTHPDYRGKGYAGKILELVKRHVRKAGASLLLVSGDRSLYTRTHCYHYGSFNRYSLKPEHAAAIAAQSAGYSIRELASSDWFTLHELAASRTVRYEQSVSELALLIHAQAVASCYKQEHRTLIAEKDGKAIAFAVVAAPGKFKPLGDPQLIEWAGDAHAAAAIFAEAMTRYSLQQLDIAVSWQDAALQQALLDAPYQAGRNNGTVFVTDPQLLLEQLTPYWNGAIDTQRGELTITPAAEDRSELHIGPDTISLTPQELVSVLFDAEPKLSQQPSPELQERLSALFPIPFPFASGLNFV